MGRRALYLGCVVVLLGACSWVIAQEGKKGRGGPEILQLPNRIRDAMPKLGLDEGQKAKVQSLLDDADKKVKTLYESARSGDQEARQQLQQAMGALPRSVMEVLKPEQQEKLRQEVPMLAGGQGGKGGKGKGGKSAGAAPSISKEELAGLKPLGEWNGAKYKGVETGFYPGGKNELPAAHAAAGMAAAKQIQPLDADGKPAANGKIVLMSVGMSNTTMEYSVFKKMADADPRKNPAVVVVDGAQGGQTAANIRQAEEGRGKVFWDTVDGRLKSAGVTRAQVQAIWLKEADAMPHDPFPGHAKTMENELVDIVHLIHGRFPNVKQIFLSSRTYGGYATTALNPEPYAFEEAFSYKWLIERQINGDPALNYDPAKGEVKASWMAWGPYLWAAGQTKRADGFTYEPEDVRENDHTHPSASGSRKVAKLLLDFLTSDPAAKVWFTTSH